MCVHAIPSCVGKVCKRAYLNQYWNESLSSWYSISV